MSKTLESKTEVSNAVSEIIEASSETLIKKEQKNKQVSNENLVRLQLIKGLSYSGIITVSINNPEIEVSSKDAETLLKTGYFIKIN